MSIAVLGSVNVDYVVTVPHLPRRGETVGGGTFFRSDGGKGANQAVGISRLGGRCVMLGAVGKDTEGDAALEEIGAEGVDVSCMLRKDVHTGVAFILLEETSAENEIIVALGANAEVSPADVNGWEDVMGEACVLLCQLELPVDTVREGMRIAREKGATTILNAAPLVEGVETIVELSDYLIVNEVEMEALTGSADPVSAAVLLERGCRGVFVTLGGEGAVFVGKGGMVRCRAFPVEVVDTVGAGDAFCAAVAVGLVEGMDPGDLLRFAVAAGCVAVTRKGARPSQPRRSEVDALLGNNRLRTGE